MRIAIVGAGAMGSVYAALLAEAGNEVTVVDIWQAHLDAIRDRGLRVEGASGNRTITGITTRSQPETADLYVIATKADGVAAAAEAVSRVMTPESLILTIQNGLGAFDRIATHAPASQILLGVAQGFGASILGPGHVHHNGMSLIRLGEPSGGMSARLDRIAATWAEAGFQVEAYDDIDRLIWEKFLCNCAYSAPCTVFRCTVGELLADPELAAISEGCVREVAALAAAKGVQLSFGDPVAYARAFGQNIQDARPSMLLDHMAERRSEIGAINGAAAVLGSELSISVPYNQTLSAVVRMRERLFP